MLGTNFLHFTPLILSQIPEYDSISAHIKAQCKFFT